MACCLMAPIRLLNQYSLMIRMSALISWRSHTPSYNTLKIGDSYIEGILPKLPYPPCLCMADGDLLAGYPRYALVHWDIIVKDLPPVRRQTFTRINYIFLNNALRNKFYWCLIQNAIFFIQENPFKLNSAQCPSFWLVFCVMIATDLTGLLETLYIMIHLHVFIESLASW